MYKRLLSSALVFGMACLPPPALAAICATRESLVVRLEALFQETLTARGLQSGNALIEVFASKETGSYTILMTRPDGISCIMSAGSHWMTIKPSPEGVAG